MRWLLARLGIAIDREWRNIDRVADELALPRVWVICPHCGAQAWRMPPHGFVEPCPVVVQLSDAMGIKIDADRSAAIRMGVTTEQMWQTLRERLGGDDD